jgi:hypothetical protein
MDIEVALLVDQDLLDAIKEGIMATLQVIPHSLIIVKTVVTFIPFCVAVEAMPQVPMNYLDHKDGRAT